MYQKFVPGEIHLASGSYVNGILLNSLLTITRVAMIFLSDCAPPS